MRTREYRWRHLALLISILLLFAVTPFVVTFRHGLLILDIAASIILVAGSYALSERKHLFIIAVVLSGISIIAAVLLLVFAERWAVILEHTCVVVLVTFFSVSILGYVLRGSRITAEESSLRFASICSSGSRGHLLTHFLKKSCRDPLAPCLRVVETIMSRASCG
jgi:hypothetical protein